MIEEGLGLDSIIAHTVHLINLYGKCRYEYTIHGYSGIVFM